MAWRYFSRDEFVCSESGENHIEDDFLDALDGLRDACRFAFVITSGYRHPTHSKERNKPGGPGTHSRGIAADIRVSGGAQRRRIIEEAIKLGFGGIGVANTFVHVDMRSGPPVIWVY